MQDLLRFRHLLYFDMISQSIHFCSHTQQSNALLKNQVIFHLSSIEFYKDCKIRPNWWSILNYLRQLLASYVFCVDIVESRLSDRLTFASIAVITCVHGA